MSRTTTQGRGPKRLNIGKLKYARSRFFRLPTKNHVAVSNLERAQRNYQRDPKEARSKSDSTALNDIAVAVATKLVILGTVVGRFNSDYDKLLKLVADDACHRAALICDIGRDGALIRAKAAELETTCCSLPHLDRDRRTTRAGNSREAKHGLGHLRR